jgi:hypothetical protein
MLVSFACFILVFCYIASGNGCDLTIIQEAEAGVPTLLGYTASLLLLWLGWKLTARTKEDWLRVVLRAGLIASLLAPSIFSDPGVTFVFFVPAWIPALVYAVFPPVALAVGLFPISVLWLILLFVGSAVL